MQQTIYKDNKSPFNEPLGLDISFCAPKKYTAPCQVENGLSPKQFSDCIQWNNIIAQNTRSKYNFWFWPVTTVLNGTESLSNLRPKIMSNIMKNLRKKH